MGRSVIPDLVGGGLGIGEVRVVILFGGPAIPMANSLLDIMRVHLVVISSGDEGGASRVRGTVINRLVFVPYIKESPFRKGF